MKITTILKPLFAALMLLAGTSCEDFYNPDNATVKYGDDFIKENSELYAGYVGLATKLQAMGDKTILLTEPRAELIEVVGHTEELLALYNYSDELKGNSYADPAKYYDVIIACNDYLYQAREYNNSNRNSVNQDHYKGLISSTLRIKAWVYFTLGKVYGQAVWFDDPMQELKDYRQYEVKDLDGIISACVNLIDGTGFDGIDGKYEMSWTDYILASYGENDITTDAFYYWDLIAPPYFALAAELALWQDRYRDVVDLILPEMNKAFATKDRNNTYVKWMCNSTWGYNLYRVYTQTDNNKKNFAVGMINYAAEKDQVNSLIKHFQTDFLLRPSQVGVERYSDSDFGPLSSGTDARAATYFNSINTGEHAGSLRLYKFRSGGSLKDDVHIYIYRHVDLYFMMAEAFNHLGMFNEMDALLNNGADNYIRVKGIPLQGFSEDWSALTVTNVPADNGVRLGSQGRSDIKTLDRKLKEPVEIEDMKHNDMEILREIILEQAAEGKTYPAMIRMARRYDDYSIIADLVCQKYEEPLRSEIYNKITDRTQKGYFVKWDFSWESSRE